VPAFVCLLRDNRVIFTGPSAAVWRVYVVVWECMFSYTCNVDLNMQGVPMSSELLETDKNMSSVRFSWRYNNYRT